MGYYFKIHHDLRLVYKKVWGNYGDKESGDSHAEWDKINKEGEVGDYNELQDLTAVTNYSVTLDKIRDLAAQYEQEWNEGGHAPKRLAYVVPSPVAFGSGRVYGTLIGFATGITFQVFESLEAGAEWLALNAAQAAEVIDTRTDPDGEPGDG